MRFSPRRQRLWPEHGAELHTNERLVVEKLSYRFHGPRRGDIVVLHDPTGGPELLIKRVVGLPGERVTMSDGRVYIDGAPLDEPYLGQPTLGQALSLVPPLSVFVIGDNRGASRGSRTFGPVPIEQIIGRAAFRYWPRKASGWCPEMDNAALSPEISQPQPSHTRRKQVIAFVRELVTTLVPPVVLALLIHAFLAQSTVVLGQSMEPNLHIAQRLMVEKVSYWLHPPRRGDIVVLRDSHPADRCRDKRVGGPTGRACPFANGHVCVDGQALNEPYLNQITQGEGRSSVVPPMEMFVMGDNRSNSKTPAIRACAVGFGLGTCRIPVLAA